MSVLVKSRSTLPSLVNDFFDGGRLFPSMLNLESNLFDFNGGSSLVPRTNIVENDKEFTLELAAPGLERKDFNVEVDNGVLTISAEKEEEKKDEQKYFMRREFSFHSFCRSFTLPENCMADKIDAKYDNGVLHIHLPKKEHTSPKSVKQIKVA